MQRNGYLQFKSGTDIRGCAETSDARKCVLTPAVTERIGYAFAMWLAEKLGVGADKLTIAVGRDTRTSGETLLRALVRGMTAADCDVIDCALSAMPAMVMTVTGEHACADGAVMVTASHHAADMNGFKLICRAGGLTEADIEAILSRAEAAAMPQRLVTQLDTLGIYKERLRARVCQWMDTDVQCPLLGLHVVVDAGNGAGGFFADWLEEMGCEVTGSMNLAPDGHFPAHAPDCQDAQALEVMSRVVLQNTADLGVILDADCDRAAIVDASGRAINRNSMIALISAVMLDAEPGLTFVTDSVTSSGLTRFISEWGGTHYRFKRGYRNVIDEAIRLNDEGINCPLAIETTGHAAFRENDFIDDGVYLATRLLCEALKFKQDGRLLCEYLEGFQEPAEHLEIRMALKDEDDVPEDEDDRDGAQMLIERVVANTLDNHAWSLASDNREGVRILFDLDGGVENAWFQLRMSVHDPVMVLNAESGVAGGVSHMLKQLYELIQEETCVDLVPLQEAIR
ncbi:MAG: phosphomannomutase/phosphoglucomutase [Clostridia bacterium]